MRFILEEKEERLLSLIDVLLLQAGWITMNDLSLVLKVSKRTISSDLDRLREHYREYITLDISKVSGVRLVEPRTEKILQLESLFLRESVSANLLVNVFLFPYRSVEEHAEKLEISVSSVYKKIKRLNDMLEEMMIEIKSNSNKYYISGQEAEIRTFMGLLIMALGDYDYQEDIFYDRDEIKKRLHQLNPYVCQIIDHIHILELSLTTYMCLSLMREDQHFYISDDKKPLKNKEAILVYLTKEKRLNDNELDRLHLAKEMILEELGQKGIEQDKALFLYYVTLILYIAEANGIITFPLYFKMCDYFMREDVDKNEYTFNKVETFLVNLSNITNENLVKYYSLFYYVFNVYYKEWIDYIVEDNVYFVSNLSKKHAEFMRHLILHDAPIKGTYLKTIDQTDLTAEVLKNHIIITNDSKISEMGMKTILINDYPNDNDKQRINDKLLGMHQQ